MKLHGTNQGSDFLGGNLSNRDFSFFFFFNWDSCKAEQPLRGMELQEKKAHKRLQDTENLFRKNILCSNVLCSNVLMFYVLVL